MGSSRCCKIWLPTRIPWSVPLFSLSRDPTDDECDEQVVANAVLALTEIQESSEDPTIFVLDPTTLGRLLVALGECTEWGRIAILNAVAKYQAEDAKEAEHICERVIPQFQHANGSVVLAAIKVSSTVLTMRILLTNRVQVIMIHIRGVERDEFVQGIMRKMGPPLGPFPPPVCSDRVTDDMLQ
jgi:AP-1 complex subunit beta-1